MATVILSVPHQTQRVDGECLAACAAMVSPYTAEQTNHALVVLGMDENYVYVNDPAFRVAPIPVPIGDFELAWLARDEFYAVLSLEE